MAGGEIDHGVGPRRSEGVDLPDPDGPMTATESRSPTWTSTPASAVVEPYFRTLEGRKGVCRMGVVSYGDGCAAQGAPGVYTCTGFAERWDALGESTEGRRTKRLLGR